MKIDVNVHLLLRNLGPSDSAHEEWERKLRSQPECDSTCDNETDRGYYLSDVKGLGHIVPLYVRVYLRYLDCLITLDRSINEKYTVCQPLS